MSLFGFISDFNCVARLPVARTFQPKKSPSVSLHLVSVFFFQSHINLFSAETELTGTAGATSGVWRYFKRAGEYLGQRQSPLTALLISRRVVKTLIWR